MLPPAEQQQVAKVLEDDAEVMSNTQLEERSLGTNQRRLRTRSSGSTPTHDRSPSRWHCSFRCSPVYGGLFNSFRMMPPPGLGTIERRRSDRPGLIGERRAPKPAYAGEATATRPSAAARRNCW